MRISRELSRCAGGNVVTMGTVELKLRDQVLKRTMDIVGGIVGCIISIPIIALVAIPLKLESPGPLIFKQRRVGRNGRVFYIHKAAQHVCGCGSTQKGTDGPERNERPDVQDGR